MSTFILDCETTGVVEPIEPIEVAWLELEGPDRLKVLAEFHEWYKPSKPIELGALAAHHIMDEDLAKETPSSEFKLPDNATIIIGHNVDYDWKAIGSPKVRRIDTLAMSRKVWPTLDSHKQGALLYHIVREGARQLLQREHSAKEDAENCLLILRAICEIVGPFTTWQAMWEYSEEARIPSRWAFGKHRGELIGDTPRDYREWYLRQIAPDPYMVVAIKRTM